MAPRGFKGDPGVFVLHRHLYTNLVKLPTWASREPEESEEEPGCSPQPSSSAHCPHPDQLYEKEMVQCKRGLVPVLEGERVGGASFSGLSVLFEACTQVALNVDFGRARGPECQGRYSCNGPALCQP